MLVLLPVLRQASSPLHQLCLLQHLLLLLVGVQLADMLAKEEAWEQGQAGWVWQQQLLLRAVLVSGRAEMQQSARKKSCVKLLKEEFLPEEKHRYELVRGRASERGFDTHAPAMLITTKQQQQLLVVSMPVLYHIGMVNSG